MGFPDLKIIELIEYLLPGFVAAWIFYALTPHRKPTVFERIVQALIFTAFTRPLVALSQILLFWVGGWGWSLGRWTDVSTLACSLAFAVALGVLFTWMANSGWLHEKLPDAISKRTSFPSEWFSAFNRRKLLYLYLHLKGDRRLYGWATEWPDHPDCGHFIIQQPAWILDDNTRVKLHLIDAVLVPATEVELVEFELPPSERNYDAADFEMGEKLLIDLRRLNVDKEKASDRKES